MGERSGFRIMGQITKRLFPTGKETPKEIPRSVTKKPRRGAEPQDIKFPAKRRKT